MSAVKKLIPANLGVEPKRLAFLGVLLAVLGYVFFFNGDDLPPGAVATQTTAAKSAPSSSATSAPSPAASPATAPRKRVVRNGPSARVGRRGAQDQGFEPTLLLDEGVDVTKIDPTLHLAVLDRVRSVGNVGGKRSLFDFYTPPPPPPPEVKIDVKEEKKPEPPKPDAAKIAAAKAAAEAKKPPPPIPLKYYGFTGSPEDTDTRRHGLFLDGEEILVAAEGDLLEDRYRIQKIQLTSVEVTDVVEDNTQTLPIVEELGPTGKK